MKKLLFLIPLLVMECQQVQDEPAINKPITYSSIIGGWKFESASAKASGHFRIKKDGSKLYVADSGEFVLDNRSFKINTSHWLDIDSDPAAVPGSFAKMWLLSDSSGVSFTYFKPNGTFTEIDPDEFIYVLDRFNLVIMPGDSVKITRE